MGVTGRRRQLLQERAQKTAEEIRDVLFRQQVAHHVRQLNAEERGRVKRRHLWTVIRTYAFWLLAAVALFFGLLLVLPGCGAVAQKAVSDVLSEAAAEKLIEPGDIPEGIIKADGRVDLAIWGHFLENLLRNVRVREDTVGPGATQVKTEPVINVNPVVTTTLLEVDGVVMGLVSIAGLAILVFWRRSKAAKTEAKTLHQLNDLFIEAVERSRDPEVKENMDVGTRNRPVLRKLLDGKLLEKGVLGQGEQAK